MIDDKTPQHKTAQHRRRPTKKSVPYASATSGNRAREETLKILQRYGCEKRGFYDDDANHEALLQFVHRGRAVELRTSARGWATMYLKAHPYSYRSRRSRVEYEQDALRQGHLAVSSIIRDWVKGQISAIETGLLSFEAVFMPFMLTSDGRPLIDRLREGDLLPKPDEPKIVALPPRSA